MLKMCRLAADCRKAPHDELGQQEFVRSGIFLLFHYGTGLVGLVRHTPKDTRVKTDQLPSHLRAEEGLRWSGQCRRVPVRAHLRSAESLSEVSQHQPVQQSELHCVRRDGTSFTKLCCTISSVKNLTFESLQLTQKKISTI